MSKPISSDAIVTTPEPLNIGLAVLDKSGTGASRKKAAKKLVDQALRVINLNQLPVRFILLLSTADWCTKPLTLPREVRRALKRKLGYEVPLIGGSMARLFCSAKPRRLIEHGIVLAAFCSRELWVTVTSIDEPHKTTEPERRARVKKMAEKLKAEASIRLGASADRHLLGIFPGIFLNKNGEQVYYDNELHEEILAAFNYQYRLIGGAAANDLEPTVGYQFANDECLKSGLALAVVETDFAWGTMMGHGFIAKGETCVSIDAFKDGSTRGYEVSIIDGKPAKERIAELQGQFAPDKPVFFGLSNGPDFHVVDALNGVKEPSDCVRFHRKTRRGNRLCLLRTDPGHMAREAKAIIQGAIDGAETQTRNLKLIWGLSCTSRLSIYAKLGLKWPEVIAELQRDYQNVPIIGALCAGEFGIDKWRRSENNNFSFWASCMASTYAHRAATRVLQKRLLSAAECLPYCQTPKEVMKSALNKAIEAGATGGQVCLVDHETERILGLHLGYACSRSDSNHHWSKVAARTNRPAPKVTGGAFPRCLLNWSLPVGQSAKLQIVDSIPRGEDILTLIVRVQHALFVVDSTKRIFHCEQIAVKAGRIVTMLAIPLLGSKGKAIATLQLSFPDHSTINRESFALWIGYSQKVAAALERAQEAQERTIRESISSLGNRIMQRPLRSTSAAYDWCDSFLLEVIHRLGAHGAHIRLLAESPSGKEEYRLVSAVGHLAKLRFLCRPVTHTEHGSCNLRLLRLGGRLTHTMKETAKLNRNVCDVAHSGRYGHALLRQLEKIQSTALLPLKHGKTILGSFVVDGLHPYLFTERNARIVHAAAELAGAVLCRKNADSDLLQFDHERSLLFDTIISATKGTAETRLRRAISHVCSALEADVGSVFLWHKGLEKLVLHTAHNWYKSMEGIASYARGEGWTGRIAASTKHVTLMCPGIPDASACTRKYYRYMVPPRSRFPKDLPDLRIGVRLVAGNELVGVVTFAYYQEHASRLRADLPRKRKLLDVLRHLITLSVENARREAVERRVRRLIHVRNTVTPNLVSVTQQEDNWAVLLEELRKGFELNRVSFYPVRNERVEMGWTATAPDWPHPLRYFYSIEPFGIMRDVASTGGHISVTAHDEPQIARWPNHEGVNALFAASVLSARGSVVGVLEFVNRIPDRDHPFEQLDDYEAIAAIEVARALGTAIDRQNAIIELRHHLAIANKIGATTVASAFSMHRLMRHLGFLRQNITWLALNADVAREEALEKLSKMEAHCGQAIAMIQLANNAALAERRAEDLRSILHESLRVVKAELTPSNKIEFSVTNELRLIVTVELFSIIHAFVNLLTNAVNALPQGGSIQVITALSRDGTKAIVRIYNPGKVYSQQAIARFLLPGESSGREQGHLGLGLPLAKLTIEAYGGSLTLSSPEQGGIDVIVSLPLTGDN